MEKRAKVVLWVVLIIFVFVITSLVYSKYSTKELANQQNTKEITSEIGINSTINLMVPDFKLKDLNGKLVNLSDYKGKIVILNFFAVWCKYCKLEMPDLNELNKSLIKENDVILLAVDSEESIDTVKSYLKSNNISMNILMDSDGSVTKAYGITGFPTTFVINRDGTLFRKIPGATNKETLTDIINKISKWKVGKLIWLQYQRMLLINLKKSD